MTRHLSITAAALLLMAGTASANPDDLFIIGTTAKSPDAVATAVESYSQQQEWRFISRNEVKQGQVTLVKICIPAVGKLVWPLGLRMSAMLPCGNIGIYENGTMTEVSVLHPRYMYMLYPDPTLEQAAELAEPLLRDMLAAITE